MILFAIVASTFLSVYLYVNITISLKNNSSNRTDKQRMLLQDPCVSNTCPNCGLFTLHMVLMSYTSPLFIEKRYRLYNNTCTDCGYVWTYTERYNYVTGKPIKEV